MLNSATMKTSILLLLPLLSLHAIVARAEDCVTTKRIIDNNGYEIDQSNSAINIYSNQIAALEERKRTVFVPQQKSYSDFNGYIDKANAKHADNLQLLAQASELIEAMAQTSTVVKELDAMVSQSLAAWPDLPLSAHFDNAFKFVNLDQKWKAQLSSIVALLKTQESANRTWLIQLQVILRETTNAQPAILEATLKGLRTALYQGPSITSDALTQKKENDAKLSQVNLEIQAIDNEIARLNGLRTGQIEFRNLITRQRDERVRYVNSPECNRVPFTSHAFKEVL